jgi:hypothetical protein
MTPVRPIRLPAAPRAARAASGALATLAALALAAPAAAGIHYRSTTRTEAERGQPMTIEAEGWVEGGSAKIAFRESANPMTPAGSYLLTRDGGATLLLVDPEEKTFAEWDLEAMLGAVGGIMQGMGPLLDFDIAGLEVEKLAEEPGGTIHGLPTTHVRYRTSYQMVITVLGMRRGSSVEQVQDIWATDALDDAGLEVWLRKAPKTGFGEIDELLAAEVGKVRGVALKMDSTSTTTGEKGKRSSVTRTTMEVTALERGVTIPPGTFEVPAGYRRVEAPVPAAAGRTGGR